MILTFSEYIKESKQSSLLEKILWNINNKDSNGLKKILKKSKNYKKINFPTLLAEKETGIMNISKKYQMPYGLDESEVKVLIKDLEKEDTDFIKTRLYKDMMYLNREHLNGLERVKGDDRIVVLKGMVNRISPDDIIDYCTNKTDAVKGDDNTYKIKRTKNSSEYKEMFDALVKNGIVLNYYPSLSSLKKILNYVELKK